METRAVPGITPTIKPGKRGVVFAYLLLGLGLPLLDVFLALVLGMPTPFTQDDFSYQFMADTFALGRVTNPVHPFAEFFQTFYIIQHDGIYASKYFPGQGLQLLTGELLGQPMIGIWLTVGLFGASLLFFLRRFFLPAVALAVSVICGMQYMVMNYFGHSYWGGSLMALAGVWTLGGAVLAVKTQQTQYAWISAAGLVICMLTRPFEGFFYLLPLAGWASFSLLGGRGIFGRPWNWRLVAPLVVGLSSGFLLLGIYNYGVTGSCTTLPYSVYAKDYASYGVLFLGEHAAKQSDDSFFESLPAPFQQMRERYVGERQERTQHFFEVKIETAWEVVSFLFPWILCWMVIVAFACKEHWKSALWQLCILTIIMRLVPLILSWSSSHAHYSAVWIFPVAVLCAFGLQALLDGSRTRFFAKVASLAALTWLGAVYLLSFDSNLNLTWKHLTPYQSSQMKTRNVIEKYLNKQPDHGNLVFVQYAPWHNLDAEWVYNSPEIDRQKIVWAHDLGEERDRRLMDYYPDREIWRVIVPGYAKVALQHWNQTGQKFEFVKNFYEPTPGWKGDLD